MQSNPVPAKQAPAEPIRPRPQVAQQEKSKPLPPAPLTPPKQNKPQGQNEGAGGKTPENRQNGTTVRKTPRRMGANFAGPPPPRPLRQ